MSDLAKEKAARLLKKRGSLSSLASHEVRAKETFARTKEWVTGIPSQPPPHVTTSYCWQVSVYRWWRTMCLCVALSARCPTWRSLDIMMISHGLRCNWRTPISSVRPRDTNLTKSAIQDPDTKQTDIRMGNSSKSSLYMSYYIG